MEVPELANAVAVMRHRLRDPDDPWCDTVNATAADLMNSWRLRTTGEPALGGFGGIVLPVLGADGGPAMVKLTRSGADRDLENEVLACWDGHHAVWLLERDDERHARLLPRLGSSLVESAGPVTAMEVAGRLARALAVPAPGGIPRMDSFVDQIATRLPEASPGRYRPLVESDVRAAVSTFRGLGACQPVTLLHGDLQGSNVLASPDGDWAVIDPLGLVGEPALEALTMLRDRWADLPGHTSPRRELLDRLHAFADAALVNRAVVVAWTQARSVGAVVDGVNDDQGLHAWVVQQLRPEQHAMPPVCGHRVTAGRWRVMRSPELA